MRICSRPDGASGGHALPSDIQNMDMFRLVDAMAFPFKGESANVSTER